MWLTNIKSNIKQININKLTKLYFLFILNKKRRNGKFISKFLMNLVIFFTFRIKFRSKNFQLIKTIT